MYSTTSAASIRSFTSSTPAHTSPLVKLAAASLTTSSHHHRSTRLHHHLLASHEVLLGFFEFWQVFPLLHHCYLSSTEQGLILLFGSDCSLHALELHISVPKWFSVLPCSNGRAYDLATIPKMLLDHLCGSRVVNVLYENRAWQCIFYGDLQGTLGDCRKIRTYFQLVCHIELLAAGVIVLVWVL